MGISFSLEGKQDSDCPVFDFTSLEYLLYLVGLTPEGMRDAKRPPRLISQWGLFQGHRINSIERHFMVFHFRRQVFIPIPAKFGRSASDAGTGRRRPRPRFEEGVYGEKKARPDARPGRAFVVICRMGLSHRLKTGMRNQQTPGRCCRSRSQRHRPSDSGCNGTRPLERPSR